MMKKLRWPHQAILGVMLTLSGAWQAAFAQSVDAPATAATPSSSDTPFAVRPGGALADVELSRRIASFELEAPEVTRGADGSTLEQVFAARCRSVVLIVASTGSGSDQKTGSGTGSIVTPQGHILTSAHVIAGADKLAVGVFPTCQPGAQPEAFAASVFKVDQVSDLALLKLETLPKDMSVMPLGDLASVRTGAPVVIIGHPRGFLMSMSQGVVSAIRPGYRWSPAGGPAMQATVIQTDGAVNPGNSGGPMMTQNGLLIGVNSFIRGAASAGLNFAVSVDDVKEFYSRTTARAAPPPPAAEPPKPETPRESCKAKVLKEWKEDGTTRRSIDIGCAGRANALLVMPEDPGQRAYMLWDRNGDSKADAKFYMNRAMQPEYSEWDDDFDGTYDYRAEHEAGDWEPKAKIRIAAR